MSQDAADGFQRRLGLFDATMLVAGSMIGSGIFIVSADIARDVGAPGWLLFIWVLTGVLTIIGALSFAELAAMMPHAGGTYVFLREAYGPLWGFLFGWTNFLVIQTGFIAAVSIAFAKYLGVLEPSLGTDHLLFEWKFQTPIRFSIDVPWTDNPLVFFEREHFAISSGQLVALGIAIFLTALNCLGVREGKFVQNLITVAKTSGLILLIVLAFTLAANSGAMQTNAANPWDGITQTKAFLDTEKIMPVTALAVVLVLSGAMVGSLFSSDAWGNVTFIAAEIKEPRRNLPRSLILGTGLVSLLYITANFGYLAALPLRGDEALSKKLRAQADSLAKEAHEFREAGLFEGAEGAESLSREARARAVEAAGIAYAHEKRVATAALERVSPGFGVTVMALVIMISTFGCVNGIVLSNARLSYAMARDGLFFQSVGRLSERGVPVAGLILQLLWAIVLMFSGSYSELLDYVIFAALLFYVLTISAVFMLRKKWPDVPRPYRAFGYPVVPALYVAVCATIMLGLLIVKPIFSWPSFAIVLAGIPVYFLWRGKGEGRPF
ncbi:MAG: amino acid permease [Gemmataceae bacterium]|nr:amino acid permease [Gemmataceae bacterium]